MVHVCFDFNFLVVWGHKVEYSNAGLAPLEGWTHLGEMSSVNK